MSVKSFVTVPGPSKWCDSPWSFASVRVLIQVAYILTIFLWTVNFIANKNSAVIKLETCIVNVLYLLQVKFCIAVVLMFECHLSVQLNHSFPYMCLFVLAFLYGKNSWSLSKHFRYTLYIRLWYTNIWTKLISIQSG